MRLVNKNFIFFIVIIFSFFCIEKVFAAGIVISPNIIDEKVKAKEILKYEIKIKNETDKFANIYPLINDILMKDGRQEYTDPGYLDKQTSLARWASFRRSAIELRPGEEETLSFEIKVDLNALPGKRYAVLSFPQGTTRNEAAKRAQAANTPELLLNIEVTEDIVEKAQINNFSTDKKTYLEFPIKFDLAINNFGNRDIIPKGKVYIYNRRGEEVSNLDINVAGEKITSGELGEFIITMDDGLGFGKFKARLEGEYGQIGKRDLQDTIYFWVLPLPMLIIFGGGILLLVILIAIIIFKKSYNAQHVQPDSSPLVREETNKKGVLDLRGHK